MFENKYVPEIGAHYSRIIASWFKVGGTKYLSDFRKWLKTLNQLTDDQRHDIEFMFDNGKLELEFSAKNFIKNNIR